MTNLQLTHPWFLLALLLLPIGMLWVLFKQRKFWEDAFAFSQISALAHLRQYKRSVLCLYC